MLRVKYNSPEWSIACLEHRVLVSRAYKVIRGTWGHSMLVTQSFKEPLNDKASITTSGIFLSSYKISNQYGYFCFSSEADALHFKLSIDQTGIRVYMWPEKKFTIHEYD